MFTRSLLVSFILYYLETSIQHYVRVTYLTFGQYLLCLPFNERTLIDLPRILPLLPQIEPCRSITCLSKGLPPWYLVQISGVPRTKMRSLWPWPMGQRSNFSFFLFNMLVRSISYISKGLHAWYWVHTCIRTLRSVARWLCG